MGKPMPNTISISCAQILNDKVVFQLKKIVVAGKGTTSRIMRQVEVFLQRPTANLFALQNSGVEYEAGYSLNVFN